MILGERLGELYIAFAFYIGDNTHTDTFSNRGQEEAKNSVRSMNGNMM